MLDIKLNQAKEISDKNVIVIPTKDIPSALVGLMAIDAAATPEENEQNILDAISCVTSAEITYAVRDTTSGDKQIKEGEVIGMKCLSGFGLESNKLPCIC